jgi:hypothetical protein
MTARKKRNEQLFDDRILPDNDLFNLVQNSLALLGHFSHGGDMLGMFKRLGR